MASLRRNPDNQPLMAAKRRAARLICSEPVGHVVDYLFRGRIPNAGIRVDTRSAYVSATSRAQLFFGIYEGAEQRLVRRYLQPTNTIVELGTSIGFLSSVAAKAAGGRVRLVGVEANPALLEIARRNIRVNAPDTEITLIHAAISYEEEPGTSIGFSLGPQHTGAHKAARETSTSFKAPVTTLRQILDDHDIDRYTLLADIEGSEAGVFFSDTEALARCDQAIVEFHETTYKDSRVTVRDLWRSAEKAGFLVQHSYGSVVVLARHN